LFGDRPGEPTPGERIVVRADARKKASFCKTGISKELLTPFTEDSTLDIFRLFSTRAARPVANFMPMQARKEAWVFEGNIAIDVDGREHRLQAGDGFIFDSARRHSFWNIGPGTARVLWRNSRPKAAKPIRNATARTTPSSRR
jgi:hypothetical protein